ncbi:hypothetical protein [Brevundimonas aveniformis]|uniref:hypothetical protein n=1 Tax=Brevundimonas aveniformis TaxID=370977 RepID=UPI0012EC4D85|nr:hypothetical protein [Brevundimonas aveniformis]
MRAISFTLRAKLAAGVVLAALALNPSVADACARPPPPPWHVMEMQPDRAIWVGRVTSVTPNPAPLVNARLEVAQSTARIERLEVIHGAPPALYEYVGATSSRALDGSTYSWCGPWMSIEPDEVVLLIDDPAGVYILSLAQPEVVARLESYQFPPDVISRLETYQ